MPFLTPVLGEGSPTKIDYRKKGTLVLISLPEDLVHVEPLILLGDSCLWESLDLAPSHVDQTSCEDVNALIDHFVLPLASPIVLRRSFVPPQSSTSPPPKQGSFRLQNKSITSWVMV